MAIHLVGHCLTEGRPVAYATHMDQARADIVSSDVAATIERFHRNAFPNEQAELGESFEVYLLLAEAIRSKDSRSGDVGSIAVSTSMWHHQVKSGDRTIAVAHSGPTRDGKWGLARLFISTRAQNFADAIASLDRERINDELKAVLVTCPAHQLDFFLITGAGASGDPYHNLIFRPASRRELLST